MKVIYHSKGPEDHLKGMSTEEIKIIRTLAGVFVNSILKKVDENSVAVHKKEQRRSK